MRRFNRGEEGQALILATLSMTVMIGFVALAADLGVMFHDKRDAQTAADAAATAGALDYYYNSSNSSATTAAIAAATANGYTTGGGMTVSVVSPATSGSHTGAGFVEVDISQVQSTLFAQVMGTSSMTVAARAVAGPVGNQACIWLNDLIVQGNATMQGWTGGTNGHSTTGCGVYAKNSVSVTGGGNDFYMAYVATSGSLSSNGNSSQNINPAPAIQNAPIQTPPPQLTPTVTLPSPCNSPFTSVSVTTSGNGKNAVTYANATLSGNPPPGCYGLGSLGTTGASYINLDLGGLTTMSKLTGLYEFDLGTAGTLTLDNNIDGTGGMTMYINTGNFSVTSTTNDNLSAPTSGIYSGILLLEPSSNTGTINFQWGSASGQWNGYIVAPGASATMQDQGGDPIVSGLYLGSLTINGTLDINNYGSVYTNGPLRSIALVE